MIAAAARSPPRRASRPRLRGAGRDDVRLLVAQPSSGELAHARFAELPELLEPGRPARDQHLRDAAGGAARCSAPTCACTCPRPRRAAATAAGWSSCAATRERFDGGAEGDVLAASRRRATAVLLQRDAGGRLWLAALRAAGAGAALPRPPRRADPLPARRASEWPLERYQTVYANAPGSAEMPSAGRAFTPELVTQLVAAGIDVAPLVLHTGVSSLEAGETPARRVVPRAAVHGRAGQPGARAGRPGDRGRDDGRCGRSSRRPARTAESARARAGRTS